MRPAAPLLMETALLAQPKCAATSAMSSWFALPSIGADLTRASQVPSPAGASELCRALGLTLTRMMIAATARAIPDRLATHGPLRGNAAPRLARGS